MKTLGGSHGGSNTWGAMEMHLAEKAPGFLEARGVKGWRRRGTRMGGGSCQTPHPWADKASSGAGCAGGHRAGAG